ncbi:hypothetical protein [Marivirga harenae]|uniref:hypothetical protein n=1 Tax=Marivirga harenae TaxID=2010992 RepID=UPI0026E0C2DC|nr:hypothetical protein [Marivirga harenae]WKV11261.1 hypothetical protein Q3Y49_13700 [Marivirga harenae]
MEVENNKQNLDELEILIANTVVAITQEYFKMQKTQQSITNVTKEIKSRLGEAIGNMGFTVSSSLHRAEWLLDLIAYNLNDNGYLESVKVALESELSGRKKIDLKVDFEKLLVINAPHKVMICFALGKNDFPNNVNTIISYFEEFVLVYKTHSPGSRYLILIWDDYSTGQVFPHLIIPEPN